MPVVFGVSTWIDGVASALVARIADLSGLPRDRVFEFAGEPDELLANPPSERFVTAWVLNQSIDPRTVAGGGAAHTGFDSVFRVDCFNRLGTDAQLRDVNFLRNSSRGMAEFVRLVAKSVQVWDGVIAPSTSSIVREPCRLAPQGITWNPRRPKTGWGWARVHVQVKFRSDLS